MKMNGKRGQMDRWGNVMIIGYGNDLRQDDGAGVVLAAAIVVHWQTAGLPASLLTSTQLLPEMAATLAEQAIDVVVFVDTSVDVTSPNIWIHPLQPQNSTASTGHQLDPQTLLLYAAHLYGCTPHAWLVTIPGSAFGHGEGFSLPVQKQLANVAIVANELQFAIKDTLRCTN